MAHPSDGFHLKVALTSLCILAALTIYSMNESLNCWPPAFFTERQISYTLSTCKNNMSHLMNEGGDFPQLYLNFIIEFIGSIAIYLLCCHVATFTLADCDILAVAWRQTGAIATPSTGDRIKQLLSSYYVSTFYFFTQLLSLGFWLSAFYFARDIPETLIHPSQEMREEDIIGENKFLCEFTVMQMGNTHPNTVECELPTYDYLRLAVFTNKLLCLGMAAAVGIHIIYTFLFAPLAQRGNAILAAKAAHIHSVKVGPMYGFTDLYMVTVLSASMAKPVAQLVPCNVQTSAHHRQDPQHYGSASLPACPPPRGKDV